MSFKVRMRFFTTIIGVVIATIFTCTLLSFVWFKDKTHEMVEAQISNTEDLDITAKLNIHFLRQVREWKNILLRGHDQANFEKHQKNFLSYGKDVQNDLELLSKQLSSAELKKQIELAKNQHKTLQETYLSKLTGFDHNNPAQYQIIDTSIVGIDLPFQKSIEEILNTVETQSLKNAKQQGITIEKKLDHIVILMMIIGVLGFLTILTLIFFNNRKIFRQIGNDPEEVKKIAENIAQGDLKTEIHLIKGAETSILHAIKMMRDQLHTLISTIQNHSISVSSSAEELSTSSEQLTTNICRQNEAASSMASAIEEMTVSINHIAENAKEAAFATKASGESASAGGSTIASTATKMQQIATSVIEAASTIATLGKQTQTISSITNVIKEVADQTNLLALNAAIEAARAGEEGRGFAVVADEVRNLAARTTQATSEISAMILNIQHEAKLAVSRMDSTNHLVTEGVKLANDAEHSIETIQSHVSEAIATIQQISDSLREQSIVCQNIARTVEDVSQSSEENHSATINSSQQAQQLQSNSIELHNLINHFKV